MLHVTLRFYDTYLKSKVSALHCVCRDIEIHGSDDFNLMPRKLNKKNKILKHDCNKTNLRIFFFMRLTKGPFSPPE